MTVEQPCDHHLAERVGDEWLYCSICRSVWRITSANEMLSAVQQILQEEAEINDQIIMTLIHGRQGGRT